MVAVYFIGQTCIMGARLIIHEDIYDTFMQKLTEKVRRIKMGDPLHDDTQMYVKQPPRISFPSVIYELISLDSLGVLSSHPRLWPKSPAW